MSRFFIESSAITGDSAIISGQDAFHIGRSLRMRVGEEITVCCEGKDYSCKLASISDDRCVCEILSVAEGSGEPNVRLTLFQAIPKGDKLDTIVQKAVELGAGEVVPVLSSRCVSRPDRKSFAKKRERLSRIALEAAKQCGRSVVPTVGEMVGFDECAEMLASHELPLICYEMGGISLSQAVKQGVKDVGVLIGSEGGFEQAEVDKCTSKGAVAIGLGRRILRCETAPLAAISIIMHLTGNM